MVVRMAAEVAAMDYCKSEIIYLFWRAACVALEGGMRGEFMRESCFALHGMNIAGRASS